MTNKRREKIYAYTCLFITICFSIVFFIKFLANTSVGADNQKIIIEANLDKYINYEISDQDKGTLIQYNVRTGIEYGNESYIPLKSSELAINLNQIDGKYPYAVKIITKRTELTNGKTENMEENYEYDSSTGIIMIRVSNQDENGEIINTTKPSDIAKDEYVIIAYYDTYVEQEEERELDIKVQSTFTLSIDDRKITQENEFKGMVKENIGELTSVTSETDEIYNGYIKSNIINGTNYDTEYNETLEITVSKKEAQQKIEFKESNSFERVYQNSSGEEIIEEISSNGDLVYKSTKLKQQDIKRLLGENAVVEILDGNSNLIATINQNTQFTEDGSVVINYENEPESIIIKTSEIKSEGILPIENTKKIKSTMKNIDYNKIKTAIEISGIKEEVTTKDEEETKTEKIVFTNHYENTSDIKESINNINIDISSTEWTNQYQNEITFNVYMGANSTQDNMLKNPTLKIELPSEVEKVILGESLVIYANGLELQDPYLETNENGNIVIAANLVGTQTNYDENTLGLVTDVKISATIILKKDIESTTGNVNLTYTNQYNVNGRTEAENRSNEIKIASYKEENIVGDNPSITTYANTSLLTSTVENIEGLTVEVKPVRGDTVLKDGDTVYEGEFIKYNVTVKNISDEQIDNIKVVGSIPEGTTYGELEADYNNYMGNYDYYFDETVKTKDIEVGTLKAGEAYSAFYEVKINELQKEDSEKNISTNITTYVGQTEANHYSLINVVKKAEAEVFLGAFLDNSSEAWNYSLMVKSDEDKDVTVKIAFPNVYKLESRVLAGGQEGIPTYLETDPENNVLTDTIKTNTLYWYEGEMDSSEIRKNFSEGTIELTTTAVAILNDTEYRSNENRIQYQLPSVDISMSSPNEGEEVKYEDEIDYEIIVRNTGKTNLNDDGCSHVLVNITDYLPGDVEPISVTYEKWGVETEINSDDESEEDIANEENEEDVKDYQLTKKEYTEDLSETLFDAETNERLPDIEIETNIPYGEEVKIKIKTTAGFVYEKTKIENSAIVTGETINTKTSNVVTHTILPYNYEENENNGENPNNPDDIENPSDSNNPSNSTDEKYSISGVAWLDTNKDGQKQESETILSGIEVVLINADNSNVVSDGVKTSSYGKYSFNNLERGKYIVIFKYDKDKYRLTDYKKSGVSNELNSDVIKKDINLQGQQQTVGATDVINLDASISNVNMGLIKNEICDLKLDKYISKVLVSTSNGTKEYNYNNEKLAKIEIKAKEIEGATVIIEYKIVITNEGELSATVGKIIDYLPEGLIFSSELNKNWSAGVNGQLINASLSNQKINAGESVELTLVATKSMTTNSTGTFTNAAEIGNMTNSLEILDVDSVPGNRVETEDDYSCADVIISISTGAIVYITIIVMFLIIMTIVAILLYKKGILRLDKLKNISKIGLFILIFTIMLASQVEQTMAATVTTTTTSYENQLYFIWNSSAKGEHKNSYGSICFNAGDIEAHCINAGKAAHSGNYDFYGYDANTVTVSNSTESGGKKLELKKVDREVNSKKGTNSYSDYTIYGPFEINSNVGLANENLKYSLEVKNSSGEKIQGIICRSNGEDKTLKGTNPTFYVKIKTSTVDSSGVSKIKLIADYTSTKTVETTYKAKLRYRHCDNCQKVQTVKDHDWKKITKEREVKSKDSVTWKINPKTGDLKITKVDKDTNEPLDGVTINVKGTTDGADYSKGKDFTTDENGEIYIEDIQPGTYKLTEKSSGRYGYTTMAEAEVTVTAGTTTKYTMDNKKETGNLRIEKKDYNSGNYLEGVSFKIKRQDENKYIQVKVEDEWKTDCTGIIHVDDMKYVDTESSATTFTTDDDGIVEIRNILKGTYKVEEVSVGENFGYDLDDKYIEWSYTSVANDDNNGEGTGRTATVTVRRRSSANTTKEPESDGRNETLIFTNKKKYIKLSGYAWEDMYYGKQSNRNNVYQGGDLTDENGNTIADNDKRLNNVAVRLVKSDGTFIERLTGYNSDGSRGEDGAYVFGDYDKYPNEQKILIEDIEKGAYVQFYYNGLNYQTVKLNCIDEEGNKVENGNTAREFKVNKNGVETDLRDSYNANYGQVENNKTLKENDTKGFQFSYDYNSETYSSTLNYGSEARYGYDGAKYPILTSYSNREHIDKFYITARTETNINSTNKEDYRLLGQNRTINEILAGGLDEITNINLGLYEREQPDLAIAQDIDKVDLEINGYSHTYEYANRFKEEYTNNIDKEKYPDGIYNVGVKFKTKYGSESYTRTVYESDCKYTGENKLKAYVTYKIAINNQASELNARVNSLLEYYDKKYYTINDAYLEDGTKLHWEPISYDNTNYAKVRIDTYVENNKIKAGKSDYVYVKFEITDIGAIFFDATGKKMSEIVLKTYAEINSYSTFNKDNKIYAGIDKDSNPGNFNIEAEKEENKQLEDDTDGAPSLIITADKARTISGTVFLDESVLEKVTSSPDTYTRNGNGEYEEGKEKTISGVKVELYEIVKDEYGNLTRADAPSGITKYNNGQNGGTGSDGYFEISGFIPSDYVIVYTWGDKTYTQGDSNNPINVNDYKGTIYKESARATYEDWYRNCPEEQKWRNIRYSDATDDYGIREAIDGYEASEDSTNITIMNSMTPTMKFGIEYADDIKSYTGKSTLDDEQNNKLIFKIPYVDFGITERARQLIDISKKVKTVKITLANGQTIVDAEVEEKLDENGNIKYGLKGETVKGLTYMGPSKDNIPKNGYLKAEIDSELIQGSTIEIGYEIIVKNNSEVDYDSLNYYKYGYKEGHIVTITPKGVFDYLDKSMVIDKENEENSGWTTMEQTDYEKAIKEYETEKTTIENYFSYIKSLKIQDENGKEKTVDITGYTSSYEEFYSEIEEWSTETIKTARQKRLADKTILHNADLEKELAPGKSNTANLYVTKMLANNDEIDLNNDVEITQIERTTKTGRKVTQTSSTFYDKGETVTVTQATGENRDYTSIIVLVISSFIILGTGIVFIKKKILG